MFGFKMKRTKPSYRNAWYDIALNNIGEKIKRDLRVGKAYSNIPFGHSLLDIFIDENDKATIVKNTFTKKKEWITNTVVVPRANIAWALQDYQFAKVWENAATKIDFTPELMKKISLSIAEIVRDSEMEKETWIFPFFDTFLNMNITERVQEDESVYYRGSFYIQQFEKDYGYGGNVLGNAVSTQLWTVKMNSYPYFLDKSIFECFALSFYKKTWTTKDYLSI